MNRPGDRDVFEDWLDREFGRVVVVERDPPPAPAYRMPAGSRGAGRVARSTLAGAVVALVVASGAGGVALAKGGGNPVIWGAEVVNTVSTCAGSGAEAGPQEDVGRCVGALATPHRAPAAGTAHGGGRTDASGGSGSGQGKDGDHQASGSDHGGAQNGQGGQDPHNTQDSTAAHNQDPSSQGDQGGQSQDRQPTSAAQQDDRSGYPEPGNWPHRSHLPPGPPTHGGARASQSR